MIKKTIKRRNENTSTNVPSQEKRYQQATRSVVKNYKQDKETAVYTKYYTYKKKGPISKKTDANPGGL